MVSGCLYKNSVYLDLERPSDLRKLQDPELFFNIYKDNLICLDEIQRAPDIFPVMRSIVDAHKKKGHFLILGSASRDLIQQSSESLAGRIAYMELTPFLSSELFLPDKKAGNGLEKLWLRGGFPESFLARNDSASTQWRENFIRTFLERDIPQLGFQIPAQISFPVCMTGGRPSIEHLPVMKSTLLLKKVNNALP